LRVARGRALPRRPAIHSSAVRGPGADRNVGGPEGHGAPPSGGSGPPWTGGVSSGSGVRTRGPRSTVHSRRPNRSIGPFYAVLNSLGTKSRRQRRQVSHSWSVPSDSNQTQRMPAAPSRIQVTGCRLQVRNANHSLARERPHTVGGRPRPPEGEAPHLDRRVWAPADRFHWPADAPLGRRTPEGEAPASRSAGVGTRRPFLDGATFPGRDGAAWPADAPVRRNEQEQATLAEQGQARAPADVAQTRARW